MADTPIGKRQEEATDGVKSDAENDEGRYPLFVKCQTINCNTERLQGYGVD